MFVKQIRIESLGNSSYLVGSEEAKACAVVDPVRDVDIYLREAESLGVRILYTLETHVHNDFLSGSRELMARTGATACASGASGLVFDHRPLRPGDRIDIGEVRLEVLPTPGHTPEHVSYLATDTFKGSGPHAIFSGGALMVGSVARSDLLGEQIAPFLGRWFYRTIRQQLQDLDDDVVVYPTHGAGSFCLATPSSQTATVTTIGRERKGNPYFQAATEDEFLELALSDLPSYPVYYKRMADVNVRGPRILGELPTLFPLSPREMWVRMQRDYCAIDARDPAEYASNHVPRVYNIPFGSSFSSWVGWLVKDDASLVVICDDDSRRREIVRHLVRIGYDKLEGYLEGGMEAWERARLPRAALSTLTVGELHTRMEGGEPPTPLDVRFGYEWRLGHVPGAKHIELGDLPGSVGSLAKDCSYATLCAAGIRASTAASILEREGFDGVSLVSGGTNSWREAGYPLETPRDKPQE